MRKYLVLCLLLCGLQVFAQEGIRFESGTLETAKQKAAKEGKVLFVDCTAAFCGSCRKMEKEVFSNPEVAAFFNEHFISYKLWMDKPEGKAFNKTCEIPAYPTLLFMDEKGNILWKEVGSRKVKGFMELARKAYAREKSMVVCFEEGERDQAFLVNYLEHLGKNGLKRDVQEVLNVLYEEQGSKVLKNEDYWHYFQKYAGDRESPIALDFVKNYKKYAKLHGEDATFWKIRNLYANFVCVNELFRMDKYGYPVFTEGAVSEKKEQYFALLDEKKLPHVEELKAQIELMCLLREQRYDEAFAFGEKHLADADAGTLCAWAALAERLTREEGARKKMAAWADRALESATDAACREEAQEMGRRLKTQDYPVLEKRGKSYSLPI